MTTIPWLTQYKEAVDFLKKEVGAAPQTMMVLSGGLTQIQDALSDVQVLNGTDIPHFPRSTAEGHAGKFLFGTYAGHRLVVSLGRTHYYEGLTMQEITLPVHCLHALGVKNLVITNAAGGINPSFQPGDLMIIRDHINMMGDNPLRGVANLTKQQFIDMTNAYTPSLRQVAHSVGRKADMSLEEGVYLAATGPSYETPAEIRAFRHFGADAVGMSTVPEVIVANHRRMQVLGISCIANMAADLHSGNMNHAEVLRAVKSAEPRLMELLLGVLERLSKSSPSHASAA